MIETNVNQLIWVGMVHIRPTPDYKENYEARGGYNNVVGLAGSEEEFIARVRHYFESTTFDVDGQDVAFDIKRIEEIESYDNVHMVDLSDELNELAAELSEEHPILCSGTIDSYYLEEIR